MTARSDLTALLFKMGFSEIKDPPRYNLVNRLDKRALMWFVGRRVGRPRDTNLDAYRMAIISRPDFAGGPLRAAVDGQVERIRRDLARMRKGPAA